jgi:hypothetical protein
METAIPFSVVAAPRSLHAFRKKLERDIAPWEEADVVYGSGANSYIGTRPGFGPFAETIQQVTHYWCVLNEPPPAL